MREAGAPQARWPAVVGVAVWLAGMWFPLWGWHTGTLADALKKPSHLALGVASARWPGEVSNRLRTHALPDGVEAQALQLLSAHDWGSRGGEGGVGDDWWGEAPVHTLRGVFVPPEAGSTARLMLMYASLGPEEVARCHACAPAISVFEFEQSGAPGWRLARWAVDGARLGSWGEMPPFHVLDWAPGQTGVFFVLTDGAQGHVSHELRGFRWVQGQWQEVVSQVVGEEPGDDDAEGHTSPAWAATWVLGRTPEGELRIQWKGIR